VGELLSADNHRQIYIPPGVAHGFCVVSEQALFSYKCTDSYHPETELGVLWNDPDLAIAWPLSEPLLSPKDAAFPRLRDIPHTRLPGYAT
jgi:dTDP-4-dehydrorhamnose 3,5-epimerase